MTTMSNNHQVAFMQSPLVAWAKTLFEDELCSDCSFNDLCNGVLLQKVWLQIDPHQSHLHNANNSSEITTLSRIKNLSKLLDNIRTFYENVLEQVLVIKLPDVINIAVNSSSDLMSISQDNPFYSLVNSYCGNLSCDDIQTLLLLLLGCAVQCEQKELFIEKIKQLDISTQHAIVECIQQITDNPESVFLVSEWSQLPSEETERDRMYSIFVSHISRLTKERNHLYQRVIDLSCELLNFTLSSSSLSSANSSSLKNLSLSNSSLNTNLNHCDQKSHYLVELAEAKSKLRRLQQELEEKCEVVVELKEVVEQNKEFCNKLRHDNLELTQEARTAKAYRDELDVLSERVRKIDRLEAEVQRYRDKMNELEFFKSRVEELREDNRILGETKTMLEEQLESSRKRTEKLPELEAKLVKLSTYANEINLQRELEKNQTEGLIEQITHLRQEKKNATDELSKVQLELTELRSQIRLNNETSMVKNGIEEGNLFDQLNQDASKRMIKLENENQRLQNLLDDYRNNYIDIDSLISLTDRDISSETNSTDSGFTSNRSKIEKFNELKEYIEKLKHDQNNLKDTENIKLELQKEVTEFKSRLHDECNKSELLERNHSQACAENLKHQRIIDSKNKKICELSAELSSIESENQKLLSNNETLKLSLRKMNDLEIEMTNLEGDKHRLEQDKKSFEKEICRLKSSIEFKDNVIDQNSSKLSTLELENKKLKKDVENISQLTSKVKEMEKENKDLVNTVTVQKNTLTTLQQDLVEEKLRSQKYADEFEKIIEMMNKLCLEKGLNSITERENFNLSSVIRSCFQTAIDNCLLPKEAQIDQLQSQLDELTAINNEMQTVIHSLRRQLNIEEDANDKFSLNSLNELQRKIACLEDESKGLKLELNTQKDLYSEMTIKTELTESKLILVSDRNSELQNENAKLQVENSLLKSQNCSLEDQTNELHSQMTTIQESIEKLKVKCEEYESTHKLLIADNESLQEIHQQLTVDYDNLTQNHSVLKQSYKSLKSESKSLEEELKLIILKHDQLVNKTNDELMSLKTKTDKEQVDYVSLKEKLTSLTDEHKSLNEEHKRLQTEHKMLQNIYKKLRCDNNELKLKHTELQGETAECKDRMNGLNVEVSKLSSYCEMVALTNNTLEAQRKKLTTQSGSLLSQYNDLLLDLSGSCDKPVVDKLRELCAKKERLEKMFKEYDVSIEKNMPRVAANSKGLGKFSDEHSLDDAIYGRLWEAETPPLPNHVDSHLIKSAPFFRQYSLNNSVHAEMDKKVFDHSAHTPPRIPPRHHIVRQPLSISHVNSHETVIELTQVPNSSLENKMSINVSTRSPTISISKSGPDGHVENNISKLQITSSQSPLLSKTGGSAVTTNTPGSLSSNGNYFMRGAFKSSSVNYGNYVRRSGESGGTKVNGARHGHHSPQLFSMSAGRTLGTQLTGTILTNPHRYQYSATNSPSFNSDSSSSHSPHESEKESESTTTTFNSNSSNILNNNVNRVNGNGSNRSRNSAMLNGSVCPTVVCDTVKSSSNGTVTNKDSVQNALNNNTADQTSGNCTTGVTNDNNTTNSNSIWYEYGCV